MLHWVQFKLCRLLTSHVSSYCTHCHCLLQAAHNYATRNTNEEGGGGYQAFNWDGVSWAVYILLAQIDGPSSQYPQKVSIWQHPAISAKRSYSTYAVKLPRLICKLRWHIWATRQKAVRRDTSQPRTWIHLFSVVDWFCGSLDSGVTVSLLHSGWTSLPLPLGISSPYSRSCYDCCVICQLNSRYILGWLCFQRESCVVLVCSKF